MPVRVSTEFPPVLKKPGGTKFLVPSTQYLLVSN